MESEWRLPPTTLRTEAAGRVPVTGSLGDHGATRSDETATVALGRAGPVDVAVQLS